MFKRNEVNIHFTKVTKVNKVFKKIIISIDFVAWIYSWVFYHKGTQRIHKGNTKEYTNNTYHKLLQINYLNYLCNKVISHHQYLKTFSEAVYKINI